MGLKAGGGRRGVEVTEYRAIFGGAGADLGLLGALQMKISHSGSNAPEGYTLGVLFGVKKKIRDKFFRFHPRPRLWCGDLRLGSGGLEVRNNYRSARRTTMRLTRLYAVASVAAACVMTLFGAQAAQAQSYKEKVLYNFTGMADGGNPTAALIQDSHGNLYGTTLLGGDVNCTGHINGKGCGVVFKVETSGKRTVLHTFTGTDGANPWAGLIQDPQGNLYGTTNGGGYDMGVVFKLTPGKNGKWRETVLHNFNGGGDGEYPYAGVILDAKGNLYGTTFGGGADGNGTVFKLSQSGGNWTETVLYSFCRQSSCTDGASPLAGLIQDPHGDLYGTTAYGGDMNGCSSGCGVVFKLRPLKNGRWTETVLYGFTGGSHGANPSAGVIEDAQRNLYGTTAYGGKGQCVNFSGEDGCGVVFKLTPLKNGSWKETVLHSFLSYNDGIYPYAGVIQDTKGNLYGTSAGGGGESNDCDTYDEGCGAVFKLTPLKNGSWKETVLYGFAAGSGGANPQGGVIEDAQGKLYGTTYYGGTGKCNDGLALGCGIVFELTP
jgi:uncharacterized repeat protein (TIGR03803 family)